MSSTTTISAIIPVDSDHSDVPGVFELYRASLLTLGHEVEFLYVLDGDQPRSLTALKRLKSDGAPLEILTFARAMGPSAALSAGFRHARGDIVLTLPVTPTVDPDELPRLVSSLVGVDMVVARRRDPAIPAEPKLERALRWLLKSPFRDIRCEVRAMTARVAAELILYGTQERFLPLLALSEGFTVKEVDVRPAVTNTINRGLWPDLALALDTLSIFFLINFLRKPFRFFGGIGFVVLAVGGVITAWLVFVRLFFGVGLADRPALILSTLMVVLGIQIIAVGLIGEIITFAYARDSKPYKVDRIVE